MGNELSSAKLASLAGKVLKGYVPTTDEVRKLAACVLTQTADKPKKPKKAKKAKKAKKVAKR